MNKREITKQPTPPELTNELIDLLTELCFYENKIASAALLFVFGSNILHKEIGALITDMLSTHRFETLLITGGVANYQDSFYENFAESELIIKHVAVSEFPGTEIIIERESRNTLENVAKAGSLVNLSGFESIAFISHSHASMRSYLTLKRFCAAKNYYNHPFSIPSDKAGVKVTKSDWHQTSHGRGLVWGEYLRFTTYGTRGDFPVNEVQNILDQISERVG